ncbi:probable tetraacyldisaccharide 4'-kinase, mitochondrial [Phalaenopsis equestris]|uniref:probable tetraacyldisaccharide 4'-kinase, mitochondrial n=1 Tax=Phalaenopsis equestris TaxID=78828 RepID=UPI0009E27CAD|nr:probable tetraacyldisaccharide 4'-kinase, mitochondrial [Phalaenopsis equestris]
MTEFIARYMDDLGIPPLILSRGYAGGDEAKMLQRHLSQTSAKIGVGANRTAAAAEMFERYGCMDLGSSLYFEALLSPFKLRPHLRTEMIGIVILDDGMQHWSLFRNAELVMINGLSPWGNNHLIPRGSLREPPDALGRAHIGVIHHADLIGPLHVDRLDFSDHHSIKPNDVNKIIKILTLLHSRFGTNATVLVTEKDYDRDPEILREIDDFQIMVLCSSLQIMPFEDRTEEDFRMVLNKLVLSI